MSAPTLPGHRLSLQDRLLRGTRLPGIGRVAYAALKLLGVEFPRSVNGSDRCSSPTARWAWSCTAPPASARASRSSPAW